MKMRKGTKRIIWIGATIVCAIFLTGLILGLITVRPLEPFSGYSIEVLNNYHDAEYTNEQREKLLSDGFDTIKFSVLKAMLEGQLGYSIKPVETKDDEGETVRKKLNQDKLKSLAPKNGQFMLRLSWDIKNPQTNDMFMTDEVEVLENGEIVNKSINIVYNHIIIIIEPGNDKVQNVKIYPYFAKNIDNYTGLYEYDQNGIIDSTNYYIYEFSAKMYTSKLYDMLIQNGEFTPAETVENPSENEV